MLWVECLYATAERWESSPAWQQSWQPDALLLLVPATSAGEQGLRGEQITISFSERKEGTGHPITQPARTGGQGDDKGSERRVRRLPETVIPDNGAGSVSNQQHSHLSPRRAVQPQEPHRPDGKVPRVGPGQGTSHRGNQSGSIPGDSCGLAEAASFLPEASRTLKE